MPALARLYVSAFLSLSAMLLSRQFYETMQLPSAASLNF
jgi:hypothetical protein